MAVGCSITDDIEILYDYAISIVLEEWNLFLRNYIRTHVKTVLYIHHNHHLLNIRQCFIVISATNTYR